MVFLEPFWNGGFHLVEDSVDGRSRDAMLPGDLPETPSMLSVSADRFAIEFE